MDQRRGVVSPARTSWTIPSSEISPGNPDLPGPPGAGSRGEEGGEGGGGTVTSR